MSDGAYIIVAFQEGVAQLEGTIRGLAADTQMLSGTTMARFEQMQNNLEAKSKLLGDKANEIEQKMAEHDKAT